MAKKTFQKDDEVLYVPNHANGDTDHKDCQRGIVSSVKDLPEGGQNVWVRYTTGSTGVLSPTKNLVKLPALKFKTVKRNEGDTDQIVPYCGGDIWIERVAAPTVTEFPGVTGTFETDQTHPASGIRTNVQRIVYRHSPTGFNFGYGGSGPADLALNICLMFCKKSRDAQDVYQEFKRNFLCNPGDRLQIKRGYIEHFLVTKGITLK